MHSKQSYQGLGGEEGSKEREKNFQSHQLNHKSNYIRGPNFKNRRYRVTVTLPLQHYKPRFSKVLKSHNTKTNVEPSNTAHKSTN